MKITEKQMKEALKGGLPVIVIINGEYYDYTPYKQTPEEEAVESGNA